MDNAAYENKQKEEFTNLPWRNNLTESPINNIGLTISIKKLYGSPYKVFCNIHTILQRTLLIYLIRY